MGATVFPAEHRLSDWLRAGFLIPAAWLALGEARPSAVAENAFAANVPVSFDIPSQLNDLRATLKLRALVALAPSDPALTEIDLDGC
jgi:hypothetical protein